MCVRGGHIGHSKEHLLRTVNFGAALGMRARFALDVLAMVQPGMPPMAMELWCGWFDHWGASTRAEVKTSVSGRRLVDEELSVGASCS